MLRHGNFYAEKQHSNKVLPFDARWSGKYRSRMCYDELSLLLSLSHHSNQNYVTKLDGTFRVFTKLMSVQSTGWTTATKALVRQMQFKHHPLIYHIFIFTVVVACACGCVSVCVSVCLSAQLRLHAAMPSLDCTCVAVHQAATAGASH